MSGHEWPQDAPPSGDDRSLTPPEPGLDGPAAGPEPAEAVSVSSRRFPKIALNLSGFSVGKARSSKAKLEHEDEPPTEPTATAPTRRRLAVDWGRLPLANARRETRVGLAALLSFLILVAALILNRGPKEKPGAIKKPDDQLARQDEDAPVRPDTPAAHNRQSPTIMIGSLAGGARPNEADDHPEPPDDGPTLPKLPKPSEDDLAAPAPRQPTGELVILTGNDSPPQPTDPDPKVKRPEAKPAPPTPTESARPAAPKESSAKPPDDKGTPTPTSTPGPLPDPANPGNPVPSPTTMPDLPPIGNAPGDIPPAVTPPAGPDKSPAVAKPGNGVPVQPATPPSAMPGGPSPKADPPPKPMPTPATPAEPPSMTFPPPEPSPPPSPPLPGKKDETPLLPDPSAGLPPPVSPAATAGPGPAAIVPSGERDRPEGTSPEPRPSKVSPGPTKTDDKPAPAVGTTEPRQLDAPPTLGPAPLSDGSIAGDDRPKEKESPSPGSGESPRSAASPGGDLASEPSPTDRPSGPPPGAVLLPNVGKRRPSEQPPEARLAPPGAVPDAPLPRDDGGDRQKVDPILHTVRREENFWTISRLYYNSGRYYRALHAANRRQVPKIDELYVGTTVKVPPIEDLDPSLIDPPARPRPSTGSTTRRGALPSRGRSDVAIGLPVVGASRPRDRDVEEPDEPVRPTYRVRAYDTLRSIARDTLGDSRRYREILDLNRDVIDDPNRLVSGQSLTLPDDATVRSTPR